MLSQLAFRTFMSPPRTLIWHEIRAQIILSTFHVITLRQTERGLWIHDLSLVCLSVANVHL